VPFQQGLQSFAADELVGEARGKGLIGAIELVANKETGEPFAPGAGVGAYCAAAAQKRGLIVRNLGDSLAFCPPIVITAAHVDEMFEKFRGALDETTDWVRTQKLQTS